VANAIEKFIKDMEIRNLSPNTHKQYLHALRELSKYYQDQPPEELTDDQVQDYIHHVACSRKLSWSYVNVIVSAFRFFYGQTLRKSDKQFVIPIAKTPKKLPEVFSREEVRILLDHASYDVRKYAYFSLLYGCGLRGTEACHVRLKDIDTPNARLWVRGGKGGKDRGVFLPRTTLHALRIYWQRCHFEDYLFVKSRNVNEPMHIRTPQGWLKALMHETGVWRKGGLHLFRHSYATHALEDGESLITIQRNLGHTGIKSTLVYVQLACAPFQQETPIDRLLDPTRCENVWE
jgi:site-specific recombinase XerD